MSVRIGTRREEEEERSENSSSEGEEAEEESNEEEIELEVSGGGRGDITKNKKGFYKGFKCIMNEERRIKEEHKTQENNRSKWANTC